MTGGAQGFGFGEATSSAELYDPTLETWSPAAPLSGRRYGHVAALLPSGKVLVTGGAPSIPEVDVTTAEVYDPATNAWAAAAPLPWAAENHTLTVLPSGKVLAAGGVQATASSIQRVADAALYDPATNAWTRVPSMQRRRGSHCATLLPSGKVLVTGGGHDVTRAGSEVYDPVTDTWQDTGAMDLEHGDMAAAALLAGGGVVHTGGYTFIGSTGEIRSVETFEE